MKLRPDLYLEPKWLRYWHYLRCTLHSKMLAASPNLMLMANHQNNPASAVKSLQCRGRNSLHRPSNSCSTELRRMQSQHTLPLVRVTLTHEQPWLSSAISSPRRGRSALGGEVTFTMSLGKSDPGRTRTYNPRLRRPMPYPLGHRTCAGAELETETRHCHLATIQSLQLIRAPCPAANFSTDGLAQKQFAVFGTAALHVCASSETPRHDSNKQAYPTTQQWQINLSQLLTSGFPHKKLTAP